MCPVLHASSMHDSIDRASKFRGLLDERVRKVRLSYIPRQRKDPAARV
jgi:hypothetical protein